MDHSTAEEEKHHQTSHNVSVHIDSSSPQALKVFLHVGPADTPTGSLTAYPFMGLVTLLVDPKHRRKGIATALLLAYETQIRKHTDLANIAFTCDPNNTAALKLYEKLGYLCSTVGTDISVACMKMLK